MWLLNASANQILILSAMWKALISITSVLNKVELVKQLFPVARHLLRFCLDTHVFRTTCTINFPVLNAHNFGSFASFYHISWILGFPWWCPLHIFLKGANGTVIPPDGDQWPHRCVWFDLWHTCCSGLLPLKTSFAVKV